MADARPDIHEDLMGILKRRGYLQPSYEIYGGVAGFFDYGPLGAALKTNIENLWRRFYVLREGMAEIQCPTISPEQVFRASGHLEKFADTVIDCPACGVGSRGDHVVKNEWKRILDDARDAMLKAKQPHVLNAFAGPIEAIRESADRDPSPTNLAALLKGEHDLTREKQSLEVGGYHIERSATSLTIARHGDTKHVFEDGIRCPACQKPLDVHKARIDAFNLMFKTTVGPGSGRAGYMRPETAQGMFMDFTWLYRYFREQMPFGAVQIGKAYRNEISPRQSLLRLREFHQMEAEVFFDPEAKTWPRYHELATKELNLLARDESSVRRMQMGEAVEKGIIANGALGYFIAMTSEFLETAGIPADIIRFRQHGREEKAHYSTDTWDAEFESPRFGWVEIVGIADRTDYDLKAHERVSQQKLRAMRRYDAPRETEVNRYVPNPTKLGPTYKGKAALISKALAELEAPETAPESLTLDIDGAPLVLTSEFYRVEKRRERVEGEWYVPHVVEPSYGVDRIFYAVLESSWTQKEWVTLKLAPSVAPIKCGVFPLMSKDGMDTLAMETERAMRDAGLNAMYDDGGAIGRRYARQDEIGTPYCVTIDYDTKKDDTVTIRERDTGTQKRIARANVAGYVRDLVAGKLTFDKMPGTPVA